MDSTFLAPPDEILDWRRITLTSAALRAGVLAHLPDDAEGIATTLDLDAGSVRILLEALAVWDVVQHRSGRWVAGPQFPDTEQALLLTQHAQFMQRWGNGLEARLSERRIRQHPPRPPGALASWLGALSARARVEAPAIIDQCLAYFPETTAVLDVAGGHGEYGIEAAGRGHDVTLLDLPEITELVSHWDFIGGSGIELFAGDVFTSLPDRLFDLVLCFGFSHTQPAERLGELFAQLASVTRVGGGIAIHTFLRGQGPIPALFAVQMLLTGKGGDTHRLEDYSRALTEAGFAPPHVQNRGSRSLLLARRC